MSISPHAQRARRRALSAGAGFSTAVSRTVHVPPGATDLDVGLTAHRGGVPARLGLAFLPLPLALGWAGRRRSTS